MARFHGVQYTRYRFSAELLIFRRDMTGSRINSLGVLNILLAR